MVEIWCHFAETNIEFADRLIARIQEKCETLAESPLLGRSRADLASGLRSFPVEDYLVLYKPTADGIEVVRVLSGYRDIEALFP